MTLIVASFPYGCSNSIDLSCHPFSPLNFRHLLQNIMNMNRIIGDYRSVRTALAEAHTPCLSSQNAHTHTHTHPGGARVQSDKPYMHSQGDPYGVRWDMTNPGKTLQPHTDPLPCRFVQTLMHFSRLHLSSIIGSGGITLPAGRMYSMLAWISVIGHLSSKEISSVYIPSR